MTENKRNWSEDRAVCDAATAGPWSYGCDVVIDEFDIIADVEQLADGKFIAEARTGWPAALERIRQQEDEINRLEGEVRRQADEINRLEAVIHAQCTKIQRQYEWEGHATTSRYEDQAEIARLAAENKALTDVRLANHDRIVSLAAAAESRQLRLEAAMWEREALGYQAALRDIDTHTRGTSEPIPYIAETLKMALPEYDDEDGGGSFE